ncbi:hypothetical protein V1527DRAFT_499439 [Lipomyces starkeyi]
MNNTNSRLNLSNYSQKCTSCRTTVRRDTLQELEQIPTKRTSYDLDEHYDTHEEFIEAVSLFLEHHDDHKFDLAAESLKIRAALSENMALQTRVAMLLRNDIFDCTGYYFQSQRRNQIQLANTTPNVVAEEFFDSHGQLHIIFSKGNGSAAIEYDHRSHTETPKFHMTDEVRRYIEGHKLLSPRHIFQNLIRMSGNTEFEKTDLRTITRQQVYNVWLGDGYQLVEELQEPGFSLAFVTPCFSDTINFDRAKMTEIFVDSTFNTNRHGYELYCVLTEYDLVSRPLSYLLLDTHAGLDPKVVHTDKNFAEVTAASLAFRRNNPGYKHHLSLWHSLRAIHQHITGKTKIMSALPEHLHFLSDESEWILSNVQDKKLCTPDHAAKLRAMIKRHLLRHPLQPKVVDECAERPSALVYDTYDEIHTSSIREMLEYCRSIGHPKVFRYFWINWYRPERPSWVAVGDCINVWASGSDAIIPISRTTMRLESHWRIPRLDVLCYILFTNLVPSRIHLHLRVEARREVPSAYKDFVQLWRSCVSFITNSRYLCKHLVSFYSSSHPDGNGRLVLTGSDGIISSGIDLNDSVEDGASSLTYTEELESLQLLPTENPEAAEENDEEAMEPLRKRPYEELLGISRSVGKNTMRKAPKSYFHMRDENQSRTPGKE